MAELLDVFGIIQDEHLTLLVPSVILRALERDEILHDSQFDRENISSSESSPRIQYNQINFTKSPMGSASAVTCRLQVWGVQHQVTASFMRGPVEIFGGRSKVL